MSAGQAAGEEGDGAMGVLVRALSMAVGAFGDRRIQQVVWRAAVAALVAMAVLTVLTALGLPPLIRAIPDSGIAWLDQAVDWAAGVSLPFVAIIAIWWLFPALMAAILSAFVDDVVEIEEARRWPQEVGRRKLSFLAELARAMWVGVKLIAVHVMLTPFYILLLFTAVGPVVLYLAVNAWFLGQEFFMLVALRHEEPARAQALARRWRPQIWGAGLATAAAALVPILNLVSAVFAAALATHLYHLLALRARPEPRPRAEPVA